MIPTSLETMTQLLPGWVAVALSILPVLMYSKIRPERALENNVRAQIYQFIKENPGGHYNYIMAKLGLKNGTLAYHLATLEREGFVRPRKDGIYKRYYPKDQQLPKKEITSLSWFQLGILKIIKDNAGITQKEIGEKLSESRQVINYHVKLLDRTGFIRLEKIGRETHCFAVYNPEEESQAAEDTAASLS